MRHARHRLENGSVPEVLDPGVTGFVVESIEEASVAVDKAITLNRWRIRSAFDERFTAGRMARDYVRLYRDLARTVAAPTAALQAAE